MPQPETGFTMSTPPIQPPGGQRSISSTVTASNQTFDQTDFKGRLIDEYKILQDKIDKIGGFRFTIKGWSVTAVIAASAAGSATTSLTTVFVISTGLALMLLFFFVFEFQQVKLSRIFGDRARKLEGSFRLIDRGRGGTSTARIPVPYTAHEIVFAQNEQRLFRWRASARTAKETKFSKRLGNWWKVVRHADIYFYAVLICMAFFLPLLPRHDVISEHWKQWTGKVKHAAPTTTTPSGPTTAPTTAPPAAPTTTPTPPTTAPTTS